MVFDRKGQLRSKAAFIAEESNGGLSGIDLKGDTTTLWPMLLWSQM